MRFWAAATAVLALPAFAADDPALYPAAQCAALWFGQDDYAHASRLMKPDPGDLVMAEAFRTVALRLTTVGPEAIDAFITKQRRLMGFMIDDYISGDDQSQDLYQSLMQDCDAFAATQPETQNLRQK
ncbi:MAG: hypothetical protein DI533_15055 [Cereibacter sphaeroides]|uniref:Uncharacterized protein n=1 Tax=Cereibacter sphaeroides TaxID=1063 RepID=A0A2W5S555_CERSP|nr:MAG: hypothetical protein DI533_15055 [Cereibacter sphaeroides]